jgi:hypothetical protein
MQTRRGPVTPQDLNLTVNNRGYIAKHPIVAPRGTDCARLCGRGAMPAPGRAKTLLNARCGERSGLAWALQSCRSSPRRPSVALRAFPEHIPPHRIPLRRDRRPHPKPRGGNKALD